MATAENDKMTNDRPVLVTEEMRIAGAQAAMFFGEDDARAMVDAVYAAMRVLEPAHAP